MIRTLVFLVMVAHVFEAIPATRAATHRVTFRNFEFSPSSLTVDVGDTVLFENEEGVHTVTGTGDDPFCGTEPVPETCSVTFSQPGTYPYRCVFHSSAGPQPSGMVGSVTVVEGASEKPNLVPFHLDGWTSPLVVSRAPGSNISDPDFYDDQDIWVDWAIANTSLTTGITPRFYTELLVDGTSRASWFHDGLPPDTFNKIEDHNLGKLPAGEHVLRLVTDHTFVVDELDEDDNVFETNVRVIPSIANRHVVLVSNFSFNPAFLTVRKGDTVDFRQIEGSHTVTGTESDPFCGNNAMPEVCSVTFNSSGRFVYRCLFHSSDGPTLQGMVGEIRVIDQIIVEHAGSVHGPFQPATEPTVNYTDQTVSIPIPAASTFWRLNSAVPLRIHDVQVSSSFVLLKFE
jgi:plastocyanin